MILGIGVDIIEIERFAHWHTYSDKRLKKIFADEEITYCKAVPIKSAERFAARFATKEAFYKAWMQATNQHIPFLTLCKRITVNLDINQRPILVPDWNYLVAEKNISKTALRAHISMSHNRNTAIAMIIIENNH